MPRAAARPAVPGASYPSAGTGETAVTARRCPEPGPARPAPPSRRRKLTRTTLQTKVRSYARPNHSRRRTPPLLSPPAPYPTETALRRAALLLAPARTASRPPGAPKQREPPGPPGPVARGPRSPHGRVRPADSALLSARPPARLPSAARPAVEPRRQPQLLFLPNFSPNFQAPAEGVGKSCGAPLPRRPGRGQPPSVRDGGGEGGEKTVGTTPPAGLRQRGAGPRPHLAAGRGAAAVQLKGRAQTHLEKLLLLDRSKLGKTASGGSELRRKKEPEGSNPRKTATRTAPDTRCTKRSVTDRPTTRARGAAQPPPAPPSSGRAAPEAVVQRVHVAPGRVQQQIGEGLRVGCARRVAQAAAVLRGGKKRQR